MHKPVHGERMETEPGRRAHTSSHVLIVSGAHGRFASATAAGLGVGTLTSVAQTYLSVTLNPLANSVSTWLVAPFLAGWLMPTRRGAAAAGLLVAVAQLAGYYITAQLRGYPAGGSIVAFWCACALIGGPIFGAGGHIARAGGARIAGLGSTLLPAAFLAEGGWVYLHELHYYTNAAMWIGIGVTLAVIVPDGFIQRRWLLLTLTLAIAGEIAIGAVYRQVF
jgi:hypothetical protein